MFRAICSDGQDIQVTGKCVLAYRNDNKKNIEMRTLADVNIIKYILYPFDNDLSLFQSGYLHNIIRHS